MKSRNIILSLALMGCTAANALTLQQAKNAIRSHLKIAEKDFEIFEGR